MVIFKMNRNDFGSGFGLQGKERMDRVGVDKTSQGAPSPIASEQSEGLRVRLFRFGGISPVDTPAVDAFEELTSGGGGIGASGDGTTDSQAVDAG